MSSEVVPSTLAGERADRVVSVLAGVSRAVARQMVDSGQVSVDGSEVSARTRLTEGSVVDFPEPEAKPSLMAEPVEFGVAYEDEWLIVVDKPAGLVVHPGAGRSHGTLAAGLLHAYPDLEGVGDAGRWGIVHRLDRDTSGLLMVGRTPEVHRALTRALARREIERTYSALVIGEMDMPRGTIDAPIAADPIDRRKRKVAAGGRPARTHYRVVERHADVTLLEVRLETGRTHQIRVHLAAIGHPVLGDPWYGRPWRVESPRVFLHAARLRFAHPVGGDQMDLESPLPPDLAAVLDSLQPR